MMVMNQQFQRQNAGETEFIKLMEAQHRWAKDSIDDWLTRKPWEYGSIDSADYHEAALRLAADMVSVMLGGTIPEWIMDCENHNHLLMNYACDGICPELMQRFPDPED